MGNQYEKKIEGIRILEERSYENIDFDGCKFDDMDWSGIQFSNCRFRNCLLKALQTEDTRFHDVCFSHSKLIGIDFTKCNSIFFAIDFDHAIVLSCNFSGISMPKKHFKETKFQDCFFSACKLSESTFSSCDLTGSEFDSADMRKCDFRTALNYRIDPSSTKIARSRFSFPQVVGLLKGFDIHIDM